MQLTFQDLTTQLPAGSIEFIGSNQLKINLTQLTGSSLTLESSLVEPIAKLMQGLAKLTSAINVDSTKSIQFVNQFYDGSPDSPEIVFELKVAIRPQSFIENLLDPTNE